MNRLRTFRESLGLQQKDFALQIGLNKNTYGNYELGTREPNADFWILVATKFHVSIDYLLGLSESPETQKSPVTDESEDEGEDDIKIQLIENYDSMNDAGRQELLKLSQLLLKDDQYHACAQFEVDTGIA